MAFTHHCYTSSETAQHEREELSHFPDRPLVLGRVTRGGAYGILAMFFLVAWVAFAAWVDAALADAAAQFNAPIAFTALTLLIVLFLAATLACFVANGTDNRLEQEREDIKRTFAPADCGDLEWLLSKQEEFPEVGEEVRQWVATGAVVRERVMRAVRAYLFTAEPAQRRQKLLEKLSAASAPAASAAV